jgi:hypothetical protein
MRIQSNHRDYYDHLQQYVYGDSITYNRNWCKCKKYHDDLLIGNLSYPYSHTVIGFCGKIYGFLKEYYDTKEKINCVKYIWSVNEIFKTSFFERKYELTTEEKRRYQKYFFIKEDHTIFIEENAPIFYVDTSGYNVCCPVFPKNYEKFNLPLSNFRFNEIVKAEEAYTELTGYINFLGMEHKTIPEMSNSNKIEAHGFNKKSFRNN